MRILLASACLGVGIFGSLDWLNHVEAMPQDVPHDVDIRPIISKSCLPCHVQNGAGPFALNTHEAIQKNRGLIIEQILKQGMPPRLVQTSFGISSHYAPLSDEDRVTVQKWARLRQHFKHEPLTANLTVGSSPATSSSFEVFVQGNVKLEGATYWQTYVIKPPTGLVRLKGWSILPKWARAVRSVKVAIQSTSQASGPTYYPSFGTFEESGQIRVLGTWGPGFRGWTLSEDAYVEIKPTDRFLVQVQYQPQGRPLSGSFTIRLDQASPDATTSAHAIRISKPKFVIAAGKEHKEFLSFVSPQDYWIQAITPEARFYASEIEATIVSASGDRKRLAFFYGWNPTWPQIASFLPPAPQINKGDRIEIRFNYSNDENCSINEGKTPTDVIAGPKLENEACRANLVLIPR